MVNPFKGEVLIEDDDGNKYTFLLGMFSRVVVKKLTGETFIAFWQRANEWGDEDTLTLFRAGLARHHKDMDEMEVADLMDRLGPKRCGAIIREAVERAAPDDDEATPIEEDAKGNARPTPAKKRRAQAIST